MPKQAGECYRFEMRPARDTSRTAADLQERILQNRTAADRLRMAFDMSEFARKLARAGIRARAPQSSDEEIERELLRQMYGFERT
jgi:hypothetical protein